MPRLAEFDKMVTVTLLRRFEAEAQADGADGRYYGAILRPDGDLVVHHPYGPAVAPEQLIWAQDTLRFLNRELHFDGAWVVVFTHPQPVKLAHAAENVTHTWYDRFVLLWMDRDGDVQIPVEWEAGSDELRDFADVMLAGLEFIGQLAAHAHAMWLEAMRALDAREHEKYKRAAGERAPSASH